MSVAQHPGEMFQLGNRPEFRLILIDMAFPADSALGNAWLVS
jgi:hypothetical protein